MISIQTNVNSLIAQQNLSVTSAFQSKTIAQLTSGYRINQSGDDAAGLAVANKFRSTIAELTQGVANGNDATAQLQIMDGGMSNISSILDRLKTLATQSASGTFTGNRGTVNAEFQNDLAEIDRQAQSIGLNSGGSFAKNLDVYLGQGSGSSSLQNGVVTLGLAASSVDSQSLGMKGMQAIGSTADLGNGNSSVASIVTNATNLATEASAGYATFSFGGAGFSDASKVKVQVNLSGVSDTASLVAALNSAISKAGSGSPQALAFAKAGIVASVSSDSNGQHLAFSSGTSAFQVQSGDQMSNAMLGNFVGSSSVGAAITTTVTGATTDLVGNTFAPDATGVTIRIQGSGLASPVDLTVATGGLVGAAITSLQGQVSANTQLQAAGISLSVVANQLVFTSATGETLSAMATGDKTNQLGLGSFARSSASTTKVDYSTITGTAVYGATGTTTNDKATMEISINGGASTGVSVNLTDKTLGATASNTTTATALTSANIDLLNGKTLSVSVDGITATTAALVGGTKAASAVGSVDFSAGTKTIVAGTNDKFTITTNLGTANITLGAGTYGLASLDIVAAINAQVGTTGATASLNAGKLQISTTAVGSASWLTISAPALSTDSALVAGSTGLAAGTTVGTDSSVASIVTALQTAIDTATGGTGTSAGATVSLDGSNRLVITNNNAGAGHTTSALGGTGSAGPLDVGTAHVGTDLTGTQLASALNQQFTTWDFSKAQLTASWNGTQLAVTSGNNTNFRVNSGTTNVATTTGTGDLSTTGAAWTGTPSSFMISTDGGTTWSNNIALTANAADQNAALTEIKAAMGTASIATTGASGVTATLNGNNLVLTSTNVGPNASIQVKAGTTGISALAALGLGTIKHSADADLGLGSSGSSFTATLTSAPPKNFVVDAGGASQALVNQDPTTALAFNALKFGNDSQAITLSANDANGNQQSTTITLKNIATGAVTDNQAGRNIDQAISFINAQLQSSNNATLQQIVAVKQNVGGVDKMNFISSLTSFNVGVGSTANGVISTGDGVNGGISTNVAASAVGAGANMAVDTQAGAKAAVAAIASAVGKLGSAQAAVGKGQNQLAYAVSLAQSQITNFSAAESQIRDANVAQQAANLSKAQTLSQASIAAMAQANSAPQAVLSLLRG